MNLALILSGGVGRRFNDTVPKQYQEISGKQVISYVIDAVKRAKKIDRLVVAAHENYQPLIRDVYRAEWAACGNERNESLKNGLEYIKSNYDCRKVIVLDAVRPLIRPELLDRYMDILDEYQAVTTARKITDSLGCYDVWKVNRERYYLLSSPEAFDFDLLYRHFDAKSPLTEVIQQFPESTRVFYNFEQFDNLKITYRRDLRLAEIMLKDSEGMAECGQGVTGV